MINTEKLRQLYQQNNPNDCKTLQYQLITYEEKLRRVLNDPKTWQRSLSKQIKANYNPFKGKLILKSYTIHNDSCETLIYKQLEHCAKNNLSKITIKGSVICDHIITRDMKNVYSLYSEGLHKLRESYNDPRNRYQTNFSYIADLDLELSPLDKYQIKLDEFYVREITKWLNKYGNAYQDNEIFRVEMRLTPASDMDIIIGSSILK
jgi:hypothetical protein